DHDVDASLERARKRGEQVSNVDLDAVCRRAGSGPLVEGGRDDARARVVAGQRPRDRSRPGAEIDRRTVSRQPFRCAPRERLSLPAGNVDTGIDANLQAAKRDPPGDPREWLPGPAGGGNGGGG